MKYQNPSACSCDLSHYKRLTGHNVPPVYWGYLQYTTSLTHPPTHTRTHMHAHPYPYGKPRGLPHTASINNQQHRLFIITYWCMYMRGVCWNMIGWCIHQSDSDQSCIGEINHQLCRGKCMARQIEIIDGLIPSAWVCIQATASGAIMLNFFFIAFVLGICW